MTNTSKQNVTCTLQLGRKKQKKSKEEFKVAIIETVEESFASLNNIDKETIYLCLENAFKIKKQEIPCKIEAFVDAIEKIFGVGAKIVEIRIIKALHKRIPEFVLYPRKGNFDLKEYLISLRSFPL